MENQSTDENRLCRKCVLSMRGPGGLLDADGICSICATEEHRHHSVHPMVETDLIELLQKLQRKGDYDCLVMCSGGKDSTASLYYMKKRYGLNVLAFTFDNGFENPEALKNISTAVEILGVDFLKYKSSFMNDLFSELLISGSKAVICHLCSIWYMGVAFDITEKYKIPTLVAGWTKGQYERHDKGFGPARLKCSPVFDEMARASESFITDLSRKYSKYKNFPKSMEEVVCRAEKKWKPVVISPHWYLPFDETHNVELIKKELNWQAPSRSYPKKSTNCLLNYLSSYLAMKNYGYTHYHVEMSKLIRSGQISRNEAIDRLKMDFDQSILEEVSQKLGYTFIS